MGVCYYNKASMRKLLKEKSATQIRNNKIIDRYFTVKNLSV